MKAKPLGPCSRNLYARGGVIYYERVFNGRRERFSTETNDWQRAAAVRDLYEQKRAAREALGAACDFEALAERYLREAVAHLAPSTLEDRKRLLGEGGALRLHFGQMAAVDITRARLLEWWQAEVEGRGRSERTGLTYLSALSGVFGHAVDLELLAANPVDGLRGTLRRRRRSKRGRAAAERDAIRPLETPRELQAFVEASRAAWEGRLRNGRRRVQRSRGHVADLLMLDAGLRLGEAAGLRWRDVTWGGAPAGEGASLFVREALARGKHAGPTKSGRARRVALSKRLRALLLEHHLAEGRPDPDARILPRFSGRNYRTRHFERVLEAAGLPRHTPKDLRDTYASQLLTVGVQLGYISRQLGHEDVATTARHYARWCGGEAYRRPLEPAPGEVPADLLARIQELAEADSPHESPQAGSSSR